MSDFEPVQYFDPREYFTDEMKSRGIEIVDCMGCVRRWYLSPDAALTPLVAHAIGVQFSTGSNPWLKLDEVWQSRPQEPVAR